MTRIMIFTTEQNKFSLLLFFFFYNTRNNYKENNKFYDSYMQDCSIFVTSTEV